MRQFRDEAGVEWEVLAQEAVVAHGKTGRVLAFRRVTEPDAEPLRTNITFNSEQAAEFAIRTLGVQELRRRVALARGALGSPS
jgi:hypothetical protein